MALKGTGYVWADLREKPHLMIWAVVAGMLWAVANTLTVFAIRNVGLSIAFPLWNINSLVGLFWGWLLFNELRGAGWARVVAGAVAIVGGACLLAYATSQRVPRLPAARPSASSRPLTAGLLWGTMYIPYRKAYISGMNPLSFVTVFTFGELATLWALAVVFDGGVQGVMAELGRARARRFSGCSWGILLGDRRPLPELRYQVCRDCRAAFRSPTQSALGTGLGALVFGELAGRRPWRTVSCSPVRCCMIVGAGAICTAKASESEQARGAPPWSASARATAWTPRVASSSAG